MFYTNNIIIIVIKILLLLNPIYIVRYHNMRILYMFDLKLS